MLSANKISLIKGEKILFENLSLNVKNGELVEILGLNGSGKSSLLKILSGLLTPEEGMIKWNNEPISKRLSSYKGKILYNGHLTALHPALSVIENLQFLLALNYGKKKNNKIDLSEALEKLQLLDVADLPCEYLSAGQRQRASLAGLLLTKYKLWLLDEPFASLDKFGINFIQELINNHLKLGGIAIIATHIRMPVNDYLVKTVRL